MNHMSEHTGMSGKTLSPLALTPEALQIANIHQAYLQDKYSPRDLFAALLVKAEHFIDNSIWIHLLKDDEMAYFLDALDEKWSAFKANPQSMPLFGIPFAIKDNIDLANVATTAACPEFSYRAKESAFVVEQLITSGAVPLGKTNMDQFATGLVGTRSPWGACKNSLNEEYISGGSSSGSAIAVAKGFVSFALGTDTAGSGRVPASLNNLVGLKPSRGLLSCRGVVPACKSLDCVSIFALTAVDANRVLNCAVKFDVHDAYARENPFQNGRRYGISVFPEGIKIGVPAADSLAFFGNDEAKALFQTALNKLKHLGCELVEIDFSPFVEAAKLLYQGPWVAERYWATREIFDNNPQAMLPVIQTIIGGGTAPTAVDAFAAEYQLKMFGQLAHLQMDSVDAIVTPTNGSIYTIEQVQENPIELNSNLGYYTNFMNLLDFSAIAVPSGFYANGVGFGITLFSDAMTDKRLLNIAHHFQAKFPTGLGEKTTAQLAPLDILATKAASACIDVVVCGAHLDGLPLNWQLRERGAILLEKTRSSDCYQLLALADIAGVNLPPRPAMVRVEGRELDGSRAETAAIEVEVWRVPAENFGSFVAEIPAPLGIGKVELADGRWLPGFVCDGFGLAGATDITHLGAWRRYISRLSN